MQLNEPASIGEATTNNVVVVAVAGADLFAQCGGDAVASIINYQEEAVPANKMGEC